MGKYKLSICGEDDDIIFSMPIAAIDYTHRGELVAITEPLDVAAIEKEFEEKNLGENCAYYNARNGKFPYICLEYADAVACVNMMNSAIQRLVPEAEIDDDIAAFGDEAISYERLIDRVDGLCYPVWKDLQERISNNLNKGG